MSNLIQFAKPPLRWIELRCVDRGADLWQAFYAGDEWTDGFVTAVGSRWVIDRALSWGQWPHDLASHGLPVVVQDGEFAACAA